MIIFEIGMGRYIDPESIQIAALVRLSSKQGENLLPSKNQRVIVFKYALSIL